MDAPNYKKSLGLFLFSYLLLLGLSPFFSYGLQTVYPRTSLAPSLALLGLAIAFLLLMPIKKHATPMAGGIRFLWFASFQVLQGGLGFLIAYYLFQIPLKSCFAFPAGALLGLMVWWAFSLRVSLNSVSLLIAALLAGGLVIALRLAGVYGGVLYGLALLNGFWLGAAFLKGDPWRSELWLRAFFYATLLIAGRALIQAYLLQSQYAHLGVVITHPYTYAALFAGILLPPAFGILRREAWFPRPLWYVLLGVLFPLLLGIFFHVRPMAGFLLGLVASSFIFGMISPGNLGLGLLSYLNLAAVAAGLPLFRAMNNLSRLLRLEILAGLFLVAVTAYLLAKLKGTQVSKENREISEEGPYMPNKPVTALVVLKVKPEKVEQFKKVAADLGAKSRRERGCKLYQFQQSTDYGNVFSLFMIWENVESFNRHVASPHVQEFDTRYAKEFLMEPYNLTHWQQMS